MTRGPGRYTLRRRNKHLSRRHISIAMRTLQCYSRSIEPSDRRTTLLKPKFPLRRPKDHIPLLPIHKLPHVIRPRLTRLLQIIHPLTHEINILRPLLHLPLHIRPVPLILSLGRRRRGASGGCLASFRERGMLRVGSILRELPL